MKGSVSKGILSALILLLVLTGNPLSALASEDESESSLRVPDLKTLNNLDLVALLQDPTRSWLDHPCALGLPIYEEFLRRRPEQASAQRAKIYAEALCADEKQDFSRGAALMVSLQDMSPKEDYSSMIMYFSRKSQDAELLIGQLSKLRGEQLGRINRGHAFHNEQVFLKQGIFDQYEDLALRWVKEGQLEHFNLALRAEISVFALAAAARDGDDDAVPTILDFMPSAYYYSMLLSDRRFESIWPIVEERVGPRMENLTENYAREMQKLLAQEPDNSQHFKFTGQALLYAGRFEEVVELTQDFHGVVLGEKHGETHGEKLGETHGEMQGGQSENSPPDTVRGDAANEDESGAKYNGINFNQAWTLNYAAYALDALNRHEDADRIFDDLAAIDSTTYQWVAPFQINRATRLIGYGRAEEGLAALDMAEDTAEKFGNNRANMITRWARSCALMQLGREEEAREIASIVKETWESNPYYAARTMLTLGEKELAREWILKSLVNPHYRIEIMDSIQPPEFEKYYPPSICPNINNLLDDDSEFQEAFEREGRIIPEEFVPIATARRLDHEKFESIRN